MQTKLTPADGTSSELTTDESALRGAACCPIVSLELPVMRDENGDEYVMHPTRGKLLRKDLESRDSFQFTPLREPATPIMLLETALLRIAFLIDEAKFRRLQTPYIADAISRWLQDDTEAIFKEQGMTEILEFSSKFWDPGVHPSDGASPAVSGATRCSGSE